MRGGGFTEEFLLRRLAEHRQWREAEERRMLNEIYDEIEVSVAKATRVNRFGDRRKPPSSLRIR